MEAKITIVQPGVLLTLLNVEVYDELVIAQIIVYAKAPDNTADCTYIESYSTVSDWERDMGKYIEQLVDAKDAIVEYRIVSTGANATERRLREVLCRILGIPER